MIPNLTREQIDRLKALLDDPGLVILGSNGVNVDRAGYAQFTISATRDGPRNPREVAGGSGDLVRVRVQLDPTTAGLTGSPTTQCGFKYFIYPEDEADYTADHRLPSGATSPSRLDYRGHMNIGPYDPAPNGSYGHVFDDGGALRLFAWKEQPHADACP